MGQLTQLSYLAITNSSLTILAPSPMNFWTNSEPETLINVHSVWWATARASSVFPVPGGPYSNTPWREIPNGTHQYPTLKPQKQTINAKKKNIWDAKVEMLCITSLEHRRSVEDTCHYNVRSTLGSFATPKQRKKRSLGRLLTISTKNPACVQHWTSPSSKGIEFT